MMNPVPWLQMTNMISYQGLVRTFPKNLTSKNAVYFDFTESPGMGNTHQIWGQDTNDVVKDFFARAFSGLKAEETPGLIFDQRINAFRVE
ncbi:hypothetical protein [Aeromonas veronii]|uniref:hypothetical protein n=1 Tax=Aeromonas veronii TaxID=654 RepID=UPI000C773EF3|nr:hypothetical protein [Aeromonas veronii]AYK16914.1 hypothetical protein C0073_002510 [Aeromonas veronii]